MIKILDKDKEKYKYELKKEADNVTNTLKHQKVEIENFIEYLFEEKYLDLFELILNNKENWSQTNIVMGNIKQTLDKILEIRYNDLIMNFEKILNRYT